jgi:hypothetical protein
MRERIYKHCGHRYLFDNSDRLLAWWDQRPAFRRFLQEGDFAGFAQRQSASMNLVYFRLDTLSRRGRRLFGQVFNGQTHPEVIPGHHRALRYLSAADPVLLRACEQHLQRQPATAPLTGPHSGSPLTRSFRPVPRAARSSVDPRNATAG